MPHTTIYVCTLPVNPEHEHYDLAERVNAELRSLFKFADNFIYHELGSVILLDWNKLLVEEATLNGRRPVQHRRNLWVDNVHLSLVGARILFLELYHACLLVCGNGLDDRMTTDNEARKYAAEKSKAILYFTDIGDGLYLDERFIKMAALTNGRLCYKYFGKMVSIRRLKEKYKLEIGVNQQFYQAIAVSRSLIGLNWFATDKWLELSEAVIQDIANFSSVFCLGSAPCNPSIWK